MNPQISVSDLGRVSRGTPAGDWFRRYWLVVGTARELRDIPIAVKVLGEELVLFRDLQGRIGLVGLHCPHRGSSLEYGDIEATGIRCPYHAWLFDIGGNCLEQPAEPPDSQFHKKVKHLSYPVREFGGMLFTYMGPDQNDPPPLPKYAPLLDDGAQKNVEATRRTDYNWFNFIENGVDPVHFSILHRTDPHDGTWRSWFFNRYDIPYFDAVETSYGVKVISRKPGPTPDTEYVDEKSVALPSIIQIGDLEFTHFHESAPALARGSHIQHIMFVTPNDNDHFMLFTADSYNGPEEDFFPKLAATRPPPPSTERKPYDHRKYAPFKGSVRHEDIVTQGTQGSIAGRDDHLAASDRGVILLRKMLVQAMKTARDGGLPLGVQPRDRADEIVKIDSFTGIRRKGVF
ncbi:MAG TPA: Rieske 2Fe-2S domain-containing protein [Candidatus Binatia bacterium]|jgi:phenylpropionate dioxygenase-like ring-hydroxylating dioxygenase large terminal subunit